MGCFLEKMVKIVTVSCITMFACNAYLQVFTNKDPLESSFSLAAMLTTAVSILSFVYRNSLPESSHKERSKAVKLLVSIFALITVGFLARAFMVIPSESSWVVPAACAVPAIATIVFFSTR